MPPKPARDREGGEVASLPAGRTAVGALTAGPPGDGGEGEDQTDDEFSHGQTLPWEFAPKRGTLLIGGRPPELPPIRHPFADRHRQTTGRTSLPGCERVSAAGWENGGGLAGDEEADRRAPAAYQPQENMPGVSNGFGQSSVRPAPRSPGGSPSPWPLAPTGGLERLPPRGVSGWTGSARRPDAEWWGVGAAHRGVARAALLRI